MTVAALPADCGRQRRQQATTVAAILVSLALLELPLPAASAAVELCSGTSTGWCIARRIEGEDAGGELGFRFGEPLDVDGDNHADIAAGSRFKLQEKSLQNGVAAVWSGATGKKIHAWDGTWPDGLFGHWTLPLSDLSGDGLADLVISAPTARVGGFVHGIVVARSPATGGQLWVRSGPRVENFGWHLAVAGDENGDGRADVLVGAPSADSGRVYLVSGKDGRILRVYESRAPTRSLGMYIARVDDFDGDGVKDLAAGAPIATDESDSLSGAVFVFSTATGKQIHHWKGPESRSGFGEVVWPLGDLDGDGKGEILIGAPRTTDHSRTRPGDVWIYSGATGKPLRHWSGKQPGDLFGRMAVAAGDLDGDGAEDVAIGAPWHRRGEEAKVGRVELRSARDGKVLGELVGDEADCWFGWHMRRAPDPDGLGRPVLLVSSIRHPVGGQAAVGVLDILVLRPEKSDDEPHGTTTRDARRSDIK